ncbi:hypothetical protein RhiirB3_389813 [Rhizophagus irregularis]|nr:hypothetical protein RhiirB3_389813 [Rhizophagus irregularis]
MNWTLHGCEIEILIDNLDDKSRAAQKVLSIKSELKGNASTNAFPIDIDGILSLEEALSLIPPPIIYSPGCTTSKAITKANGSPPTRVLLWEDFFGEVNVKEISEILGTYNHFAKPSNNEQGKRSGSVSRLYPSKDPNPRKLCSPFASTRNTTTRTTYKNCKHSGKSSGQRSIPNTVNLNLLDKYIRRMVAVRIRKFEGQERLDPLQQERKISLFFITCRIYVMFHQTALIKLIGLDSIRVDSVFQTSENPDAEDPKKKYDILKIKGVKKYVVKRKL